MYEEDSHSDASWEDDQPLGVARPGGARRNAQVKPETTVIPAGRGWRVRTEDDDGNTVILVVAAWVGDEDGDVYPWVVTADRQEIYEVPGSYVILQPGEPDDAQVGDE